MSERLFGRIKTLTMMCSLKTKAKISHLIGLLIMFREMISGEPFREAYKRISKTTTSFVRASEWCSD